MLQTFSESRNNIEGVHKHSSIEESASIGKKCYVGSNVYISENVVIGDNVKYTLTALLEKILLLATTLYCMLELKYMTIV